MVQNRQAYGLAISAVMIISPLDRKLLRDLARLKGQMLAVSVVMGCGLAMMICTRSLIHTLEFTRDAYYEKHRMADVFGSLKRAPLALAERLAAIPDVAAVEARVVVGGKMHSVELDGVKTPSEVAPCGKVADLLVPVPDIIGDVMLTR